MEEFMNNYGLIITAVLFVIFGGGFVLAMLKNLKIEKEGLPVDAVVSRVEYDTDEDGSTTENVYVVYEDADGIRRESLAAVNSARKHCKGDKLRVKFLPGDYKQVVETKE